MQLDFFAKLAAAVARAVSPTPAIRRDFGDDAADLQERARALLQQLGADTLAARVQVRWNRRMRSTAGTAFARTALVTLNPRLREFGAEEIDRTLKHELAHLLAHDRAGRRRIAPHGREWRQACLDLGLKDETRCHTLPLPQRRVEKRHHYQCPACDLVVRRARPMRRKSACLACCRRHNRGRYDDRFRFRKLAIVPAAL